MFAQRLTLLQQFHQRRLDACFPLQGCHLQDPHILPVGAFATLLTQRIISLPIRRRRIQIFAIHVTREGPGLAHQPVDHVAIVDAMLRLTTQPLHRLHPGARVPHLDPLAADARFHPLSLEPRRDGVRVFLYLDRGPLAHAHALSLQGLQPPVRQRPQPRLLRRELVAAAPIPPRHQRTHELPVFLPTREIAAATQQQLLLQGFLETPMALFAIAVLVPAVGIGCLGGDTVMTHQGLVAHRVLFRMAFVIHRQRHAVRAMTLRHRAQLPERVLQPLAQAGEALRETQRHVFPVRVGQHKMIDHVGERLAANGHAKLVHVREIGRAEPAWFMHLREENLLGRPVLCFPLPRAPFQRAPLSLPVLIGVFALQPLQQRLGLQSRLPLKEFLQRRPDLAQRIWTSPPGVRRFDIAGQLAQVAIFPSRLAIHTAFHRRHGQRCSLVQVVPHFLHLGIRNQPSRTHEQLLLHEKLSM